MHTPTSIHAFSLIQTLDNSSLHIFIHPPPTHTHTCMHTHIDQPLDIVDSTLGLGKRKLHAKVWSPNLESDITQGVDKRRHGSQARGTATGTEPSDLQYMYVFNHSSCHYIGYHKSVVKKVFHSQ